MTKPVEEVPLPSTAEREIAPLESVALAGSPELVPADSIMPTVDEGSALIITETPTAGRRDTDEKRLTILAASRPLRDAFYWLFGILLEPKPPHKPSITRVSWWITVLTGVAMFGQEVTHAFGAHSPSNASWQAWAIAFTVCGSAVGFPKVVDFWKAGGATAIGTIGQSVRDKLPSKEPSKKDDERVDV